MISRIIIDNFQSHEHTEIDLSKGVNVFTGQSDSGKTAVLRAIRWVVENRPSGEAFRSHWGGDTVVRLVLDGGTWVERRKGKGRNDYQIGEGEKDIVQQLSAMGQDVPEPVREVLGFSGLNFQLQMDAPFLLSESPGEVARQLNEVADIGKIDSSLTNINRMARENKQVLLSAGQNAAAHRLELMAFRELDAQLSQVRVLREKDRRKEELLKMVEDGEALLETHETLAGRLAEKKDPVGLATLLSEIMDFKEEAESIDRRINLGSSLLGQRLGLTTALSLLPPEGLGEQLDQLIELNSKAERLEEQAESMEKQLICYGEVRDGLASFKHSVKTLEDLWLVQMPSICPLCEQRIK